LRYNTYAEYLKKKYNEKVYKIPVNLPLTCPNRDGEVADGGCTFCGDVGTGFEAQSCKLSVEEQMLKNIEHISKRYKAKKFIAYFQNFTNTYMPLETFEKRLEEACIENVFEISVSSRPDCIHEAYLDVLERIKEKHNIEISVELGLQSINPVTLHKINRGHSLAEWIDAVRRIERRGFECCTHLILNLPWDDDIHTDEAARMITAMGVGHVKLHSLYILRGTEMGKQYESGALELIDFDAYVARVVRFIRLLGEDVVIHRIAGRAPAEETLFCNWDKSWWLIKEAIENQLEAQDARQGDRCDYLNGKAVQKFVQTY
jgi:hypothetical protein